MDIYKTMERSQKIKDFINAHSALFWYTMEDKGENVSDELLVETILNYGTLEDVKQLFLVMGIKNTSTIFYNSINQSERRKNNYFELTLNYFDLLFKRYAQ